MEVTGNVDSDIILDRDMDGLVDADDIIIDADDIPREHSLKCNTSSDASAKVSPAMDRARSSAEKKARKYIPCKVHTTIQSRGKNTRDSTEKSSTKDARGEKDDVIESDGTDDAEMSGRRTTKRQREDYHPRTDAIDSEASCSLATEKEKKWKRQRTTQRNKKSVDAAPTAHDKGGKEKRRAYDSDDDDDYIVSDGEDDDDQPECAPYEDSVIRCYEDNGQTFPTMLLSAGSEMRDRKSGVAAWLAMTPEQLREAVSRIPLPKHAGYKSQQSRMKAIVTPNSDGDIIKLMRDLFTSSPQQLQKRHPLPSTTTTNLLEGECADGRIAVDDSGGKAAEKTVITPPPTDTGVPSVKHAKSIDIADELFKAVEARGLLIKREPFPSDKYREPTSVHEYIGIDVFGLLAKDVVLNPKIVSFIGDKYDSHVEVAGKRCSLNIDNHQVYIYPNGKIECLKTASIVDGKQTLGMIFATLRKFGFVKQNAKFSDAKPSLTRALHDAKLGFPVNLREFAQFMVNIVGESVDAIIFPEDGPADRIKWNPSFDSASTVQLYATGSINYFMHESTAAHTNATLGDVTRDIALVTRYTNLHRMITTYAFAAMSYFCDIKTFGSVLGSLPLPRKRFRMVESE